MLSLSHRDARPLHVQVREGLRQLIVSGSLQPGERLPAVRELATTLAINPNTIARAYRDLEGEGYAHSVAGKGTFVSPHEDIDTQRRAILMPKWERITAELLFLGADAGELIKRLSAAARDGGFR